MGFVWPSERSELSVWDIACLTTGQRASDAMPTDDTKQALDDLWRASRDGMVAITWPDGLAPACPNDDLPNLAGLRLATISRFAWRRYLTRRLREELIAEGFREENLDRYADGLIRENVDQAFEEIKASALQEEALRQRCLSTKSPLPLPDGTTLLTPWASQETWSPEEAAQLVCGLLPEDPSVVHRYLNHSKATALGICGNVFAKPDVLAVEDILEKWGKRWTRKTERPDSERPGDFIAWCKRRSIDTTWLRTLEIADEGSLSPQAETQEQRRARRYQMCLDAGLKMPTDDYGRLPNGIKRLAEEVEKVSRQSFAEDIKAHIRKLQQHKS
mgnify:CR=1 FL=1